MKFYSYVYEFCEILWKLWYFLGGCCLVIFFIKFILFGEVFFVVVF